MADINLSVQIEGLVDWLELEDEPGGYVMHAESFASKQVTNRVLEAEGDWVEGSYTMRGVRGNVTEPVVVIVSGSTPYECQARTAALTDALDQLQFGLVVRIEDWQQTWACFKSDYTIESSSPLIVAKKAIVRANVKHLPAVTHAQVVVP